MTDRLTSRQRHDYQPPPCPVCGGETEVTHWIEVVAHDQDPEDPDEPIWMPGTYACRDFDHEDTP